MSTETSQMLTLGGIVGVMPVSDVDQIDLVR